ncbi:tRNA lysidine(34) synthetase TilS [Leptobacterium sp. I13]|uniref:tRNA lysidine(34) synthetase TilS n=1 Tax=Leptobacterium meishanense TaxID=3128904 RepID=UPI0030ED7030
MQEQFHKHITNSFPFLKNSKILIAISGGVDSVVLAHLSHQLRLNIALAHCNFNLRDSESDADEAFVTKLSKQLSVTLHVKHFETKAYAQEKKCSIQMAARELRYKWFDMLCETIPYDYVLTAHHADDNLETFLINMSRGTGLEGLAGIPAVNQNIIRPLLPFSRSEIEKYATENKLMWREDSSNEDTKYLRNKIRHHIVPQLKKLHPEFLYNFQKTQQYITGSLKVLKNHIDALKKSLIVQEGTIEKYLVTSLQKLVPQEDYLYGLFRSYGFTETKDIINLLNAQSGKQLFSETHRMIKDRDYVLIQELKKGIEREEYLISEETKGLSEPISIKIAEVSEEGTNTSSTIYVNEKLKFPLSLRKWKEGDYFYPKGMKGKKKLSDYFKDEKYSLIAKENQWLLCSGNSIVWIIGKRVDNRFIITNATTKIFKINIL